MRASSRLSSKEFFLFLLPLFFVLHGSTENFPLVSFADAMELTGVYILVTLGLLGISYLIFPSFRKAAFFTFFLVSFHLFFGPVHDFLKEIAPGFFISKYSFILPASLVTFVWLFFFLLRTKANLQRAVSYLNIVFLILLFVDFGVLFFKYSKQPKKSFPQEAIKPNNGPDIYLIIADEYADSSSLHQVFGFNNSLFQNALRKRGFHIVQNSRSNYNFTPFSVASLFQMNYLTGIKGHNQNPFDRARCYELINNSPLWKFLNEEGYEVKNHSIFDLADIPTASPQNYVLIGKHMVESQTLLARLNRDLGYHLVTTLKLQSEINRYSYWLHRCNQFLLDRLVKETQQPSAKPRFVYAHISMPHYPYYFKKDGTPNPIEYLQEGQQVRKPEYLEYLQYSNPLFLEAIDKILVGSKQPPIIIFMGDHGFREFDDGFEKNKRFYYMNMNAVLLPSGYHKEFYDGISTVNQLRALLNTHFRQRLPYIKDSSILLYE